MNCSELRDHYERYVVGMAGEPEQSEIRAHLNRQCGICTDGIRRAREVVARVGGTAGTRARMERRRFGLTLSLALALALALFAGVYFGGREHDQANELARVREQSNRQTVELTRVNQALAILTGADTTITSFEGQSKARGKVYVSPSYGVLLIAGDLPPAPPGKAYEMWIVRDGKAKAAGMFQSAPDSSAMHMQHATVANNDAVAVTMENEAGADQPSSTPLFLAPIRALMQ